MTHRARNGGPPKTHRKQAPKNGQPKKLNHPTPPSSEATEPTSIQTPSSTHPCLGDPTDQDILDLVHRSLHSTLTSEDLIPNIQKIKGLLYEKKWLEVFTDPNLLESYAARWVPSRALCYRELFSHLEEVRNYILDEHSQGGDDEDEVDSEDDVNGGDGDDGTEKCHMVSLGGGAGSEYLAFASLVKYCQINSGRKGKRKAMEYNFTSIDIGTWTDILDKFSQSVNSTWSDPTSPILLKSHVIDLLNNREQIVRTITSDSPSIVTLLFTLTELLTQSPTSTISLLKSLTDSLQPGALFLIADSASDISSFSLGTERKWPTYIMIDMIMLKLVNGDRELEKRKWKKVGGVDSRWFRIPEGVGVGWPVKLENTRYWYRLYRKL